MANDTPDVDVGQNPVQKSEGPPPATATWRHTREQFRRLLHLGEFAPPKPPPPPDPPAPTQTPARG